MPAPLLHDQYLVHQMSPFLIEFPGGWGIRYYGLAYALGFLGLYLGLQWQARRGWCRLQREAIGDFVTWMVVGILLGGRLFYCLFYSWPTTWQDPLSVLRIWEGGMASHGGILGAIVVIYSFARHQGLPFYHLADATALCTPPALFLGRLANWINGELWGRPSLAPWAMIFPEAPLVPLSSLPAAMQAQLMQEQGWASTTWVNIPRHPSQLYEAGLEGALLFGLLLLIRWRCRVDGPIALTFIGGYGVLRTFVEFFREPDSQIGYYAGFWTQGQLLSLVMIVLALLLAWLEWKRVSPSLKKRKKKAA